LLKPPESTTEEGGPGEAEPLPLQSLDFVQAYIPSVDKAKDAIIQEMESMVFKGLTDLVSHPNISCLPADMRQNQPLLSSSLQTAHNLGLLPDLVSNLLADLNDAVVIRIQKAFDPAAIGREVAGKGQSEIDLYRAYIC
jgi:hypothetical protein